MTGSGTHGKPLWSELEIQWVSAAQVSIWRVLVLLTPSVGEPGCSKYYLLTCPGLARNRGKKASLACSRSLPLKDTALAGT